MIWMIFHAVQDAHGLPAAGFVLFRMK